MPHNAGLRGHGQEAKGWFRVPNRRPGRQQRHADRPSQIRAPRRLSEVLRVSERCDTARAGLQRRHRLQ